MYCTRLNDDFGLAGCQRSRQADEGDRPAALLADRLAVLHHSQFGFTLGVYTYVVDAAGNRTGAIEALRAPDTAPGAITPTTIIYTYDALYRPTYADYSDRRLFHYAYDGVGNRTEETILVCTTVITYDSANPCPMWSEPVHRYTAGYLSCTSSGTTVLITSPPLATESWPWDTSLMLTLITGEHRMQIINVSEI